MHWEPHEFALPHLPKGLGWYVAFDTGDSMHNGYFESGQEPETSNQKRIMAPPRTILVLIGKKVQEVEIPEKRDEANGGTKNAHI